MNSECSKTIGCLVAYNGSLQIAHWAADTKSNEHRTLGELYDKMIELTDDYVEVCMGKYGVMGDIGQDCCLSTLTNPTEEGLKLVEKLREYLTPKKDDDLLNIVADMSAALNKAKYLLKSKSGGGLAILINLGDKEEGETEQEEEGESEEEQEMEKEAKIEKPIKKQKSVKKEKYFDTEGMN